MSVLNMLALLLNYCKALCLSNECMCLFVITKYFICASSFSFVFIGTGICRYAETFKK